MIIAPAILLQQKADAFRLSARPPATNPAPLARRSRQTAAATPPLFLPAQGTAGLKLQVSRLISLGGQFRPAGYPAPGIKIRRSSMNPTADLAPEVTQRAVIKQPAALMNARPAWESYLYD